MAPTGRKESPIDRPGQRRRAERLRRGWEERVGIAAEIIPKVSIDLGRSLSRGLWPRQLPLCKGAFGPAGGRADTQVRPYTVIGVHSNPRRGGAEPAYASTGSADLRADAGIGPYGRTGDTAPLRPSE